jgi:D-glycero-alpha-D-manno-heptose-7-phosphate kinase
MIIVQTPLRVSFFGGGTDFPSFFQEHGGAVLSTAIDKYIFVTVKPRFDRKLRVGYTKTEMVDEVGEIQHELIREALRLVGVRSGIEITTMGDIPSAGSGLGSSSTVTVGALHALYSLQGELVSAETLANQACEIEIEILGKPIGIQDQYIAALGGFRLMEFMCDGTVRSERIHLSPQVARQLNENTMLFFTGMTRRSETILHEQKQNIRDRLAVLCEMKQMAHRARDALAAAAVDSVGELLHEGWQLKKQLARDISNSTLDDAYLAARRAGALGGKVTGAGGGGFLLLYCRHGKQDDVRSALSGMQELQFRMEADGSKVIFNYQRQ